MRFKKQQQQSIKFIGGRGGGGGHLLRSPLDPRLVSYKFVILLDKSNYYFIFP